MELIKPDQIQQLPKDQFIVKEIKHWSYDDADNKIEAEDIAPSNIDDNDTTASEEQSPKIPYGSNVEGVGSQSVSMVKGIEFINDPGMVAQMKSLIPGASQKASDSMTMHKFMSGAEGMTGTEALKSKNNIQKFRAYDPEGSLVERQVESGDIPEGMSIRGIQGRSVANPELELYHGKRYIGPRGGTSRHTGEPWHPIVRRGGIGYYKSLSERINDFIEKTQVDSIGLAHTGPFVEDDTEFKPQRNINSTPTAMNVNKQASTGGHHRVYLKPGEEPPMGYKKFQGEQGGAYYLARTYDEIRSEKPSRGPRGGRAAVSEGGERLSALKEKYPNIKLESDGDEYKYSWRFKPKDTDKVETISGRGDLSEIDRKIEDDLRIRTQRRAEIQGKQTTREPSSIPIGEIEQRSLDLDKEIGDRIKPIRKNSYLMDPAPDSTDAELQKQAWNTTKKLSSEELSKINAELDKNIAEEREYNKLHPPKRSGVDNPGQDRRFEMAANKPTINPASIMSKEGGVGTTSSGAAMTPTFGGGATKLSKKIKFFIGKMEAPENKLFPHNTSPSEEERFKALQDKRIKIADDLGAALKNIRKEDIDINSAIKNPKPVIDKLIYSSYRHNRKQSPHITPEQWGKVFQNVPDMEAKFQSESNLDKAKKEPWFGDIPIKPGYDRTITHVKPIKKPLPPGVKTAEEKERDIWTAARGGNVEKAGLDPGFELRPKLGTGKSRIQMDRSKPTGVFMPIVVNTKTGKPINISEQEKSKFFTSATKPLRSANVFLNAISKIEKAMSGPQGGEDYGMSNSSIKTVVAPRTCPRCGEKSVEHNDQFDQDVCKTPKCFWHSSNKDIAKGGLRKVSKNAKAPAPRMPQIGG